MARPFILLGSVIVVTLMLITCLPSEVVPIIIGVSAVLGIVCLISGRKLKFMKTVFVVFLAVCLASSSYFLKIHFTYYPALQYVSQQNAVVTGIVKEVNSYNNTYYYILDDVQINDSVKTKHSMQITHKNFFDVTPDDVMTFNVRRINGKSEIPPFYMPDEDGVHLYAYSDGTPDITKAEDHTINYYLWQIRSFVAETLNKNIEKESAGAINAMMTGDKTYLSDETMLLFGHSGISHLFAVSGFHLSLWTSAIFVFFEKLSRKLKTVGYVFAIVFILFFMALTGFTPSVVRSGIMMLIFIAGQLTKYKSDSVNSLFIALTLILLINPYCVTSTSLQMSFLATLGIVTLSSAVTEPVYNLKEKIKPEFIFDMIFTLYTNCAISLIVTIFTCPVSAVNFGYFSFFAPLTNLLCLPVAQLILPLSSLGIATSFLRPVSEIFFMLCQLIMKYILFVAEKISDFAYSTVNVKLPAVRIALFAILAVTIILICFYERKNKQLRIITAFSVVCFVAVSVSVFTFEKNSFSFYVPSVGNGTAVVCNINGKKLVIGCGGEKYKEYIFTDTLNTVAFRNFDLLLIPRATESESAYAGELLNSCTFDSVITCSEKLSDDIESRLSEDVSRGETINIMIDENTNLLYINNDDFNGARIESQNFTCTILFRPASDFSKVPEQWRKGNLLISRQNLPQTEIYFDDIILSTDSVDSPENNIRMTSLDGNIIYTFNQYTGAECYAV